MNKYFILLFALILLFGSAGSNFLYAQSEPVEVGFRDFNFGTRVTSQPTGEKPQSKLWFNDGSWWGSLWNPGENRYEIYRFDRSSQSFFTTGVAIDDRASSKADALWDGQKLYVVSNIFSKSPGPVSASSAGRLYRYSYDSATRTYRLDSGFPVTVNSSKSETLVIDKDSTGQLWVTWTEGGNVMINRSVGGDDLNWGTPFKLPSQTSSVQSDDISSLIAMNDANGSHIGVLWSNQNDERMYFALHPDGNSDTNWLPEEMALNDPQLGQVADDHINLKIALDPEGALYAVTKTGLSASEAPLVYLLKRTATGSWEKYVFGKNKDDHTRPIVLLNPSERTLYVFAMSDDDGTRSIYYKSANMDNISFPQGAGTLFIKSATDVSINDPTSTKQNVNSGTGLLVLASDKDTDYYFHNTIDLGDSGPLISDFSPQSGLVGTEVTITGSNLSDLDQVWFGETAATQFSIVSDQEIRAVVPAGAVTGKITVSNSLGSATSFSDFIVHFTLALQIQGQGSVGLNPDQADYAYGSYVDLTAYPAAGWQFQEWQGDLIGTSNPAQLLMDGDKAVTAVFSESNQITYTLTLQPSEGGTITLDPSGGVYEENTMVTLTASADPGYMFSYWQGDLTGTANPASIIMDADKTVQPVFEPIPAGSDIVYQDMKSGSSSSSSSVTVGNLVMQSGDLYVAMVSTKPYVFVSQVDGMGLTWIKAKSQASGRSATGMEVWYAIAMIDVARYSGVNPLNPIGNIVSANTNGIDGLDSGGTDSPSYSIPFTTNGSPSMVVGAIAMRNKYHEPGGGFIERYENFTGSGGDVVGIAGMDQSIAAPSAIDVQGTFSNTVDWAVVTVELLSNTGSTESYNLTVSTSGSGTVDLNPAGGVYDSGSEVTLAATAALGWQFSGWSGDVTGTANPVTVLMDGNKSVTATFTEEIAQYTLTVSTTGEGQVELTPPSSVYDTGTEVTMTATAASGWQFSGWSGDVTGTTNPVVVTMDTDKSVTATFTQSNLESITYLGSATAGALRESTIFAQIPVMSAADVLYLCSVSTDPPVPVDRLESSGLAWTRVSTLISGRATTGLEIWHALGNGNLSHDVTVHLGNSSKNSAVVISAYGGTDLIAPIANVKTVTTENNFDTINRASDSDVYSFSFNTSLTESILFVSIARLSAVHEPGPGFTERVDFGWGTGGDQAGVAINEKKNSIPEIVQVQGSFDKKYDWAVIALELKGNNSLAKRLPDWQETMIAKGQPKATELLPNYPNPFNPETTLSYSLADNARVTMEIFDIQGKLVRVLVQQNQTAGHHNVIWDGRDEFGSQVASGVYLCVLQTGNVREILKISLLK